MSCDYLIHGDPANDPHGLLNLFLKAVTRASSQLWVAGFGNLRERREGRTCTPMKALTSPIGTTHVLQIALVSYQRGDGAIGTGQPDPSVGPRSIHPPGYVDDRCAFNDIVHKQRSKHPTIKSRGLGWLSTSPWILLRGIVRPLE